MPGRVRSLIVVAATAAPVCPALTTASASPFLTRSTARLIDESFFRRTESTGLSGISTTCVECAISTRPSLQPCFFSSVSICGVSPTRKSFSMRGYSRSAMTAPATRLAGRSRRPWHRARSSQEREFANSVQGKQNEISRCSAMLRRARRPQPKCDDRAVALQLTGVDGEDLAAFVVAAGCAGGVRLDGAAALRAFVHLRRVPAIGRLARAQPHLRHFAFWDSHKSRVGKQGFAKTQPVPLSGPAVRLPLQVELVERAPVRLALFRFRRRVPPASWPPGRRVRRAGRNADTLADSAADPRARQARDRRLGPGELPYARRMPVPRSCAERFPGTIRSELHRLGQRAVCPERAFGDAYIERITQRPAADDVLHRHILERAFLFAFEMQSVGWNLPEVNLHSRILSEFSASWQMLRRPAAAQTSRYRRRAARSPSQSAS